MKYNTLKTSLKNGMVSQRLRGREKEGDLSSSAEILENFFVDRVGNAVKRGGILLPPRQPFKSTYHTVPVTPNPYFDNDRLASGQETEYFAVNLKGKDYIFRFNLSKKFNEVLNDDYSSAFLNVFDNSQVAKFDCRPFAPYVTTGIVAGNEALMAYNYSAMDTINATSTSGLHTYLYSLNPHPRNVSKISDRTVLFTCHRGPAQESNPSTKDDISFYVSLIDMPTSSGATTTTEVFIIVPYFVNLNQLVTNITKNSYPAAAVGTATFSGTSMIVSAVSSGGFKLGQIISTDSPAIGPNLEGNIKITAVPVGSTGGPGTYTLSSTVSVTGTKTIKAYDPNFKWVLHPSCFPFNVVNTDTKLIITAYQTSYLGVAYPGSAIDKTTTNVHGKLANIGDSITSIITVPKSICIDNVNPGIITPDALIGKYISIPSENATVDYIYFVTAFSDTVGNDYIFTGIQLTGGQMNIISPYLNSSRWKVSTFGGQTHPKLGSYTLNRIVHANAGIEKSSWWASAVHPDALLNVQGFMQAPLMQDTSGDSSGLNYAGLSSTDLATKYKDYGVVDPYRFGFNSKVPNLGTVNFIESRRKIHFGTNLGECQLTINNGNFSKADYEQIKVRTNSAYLVQTSSGDGKFFYVSNNGKDIRFISTEDKDYESVDGLLTAALEGIPTNFVKLVWYEKLNSVIAKSAIYNGDTSSYDNRFFAITIHEDTQIKAITELKFAFDVFDVVSTNGALYFIYNHRGYQHIGMYSELAVGDLCYEYPSLNINSNSLGPMFYSQSINAYHKGTEYTYSVNSYGELPSIILPDTVNYANPYCFYGYKITCKIKTAPISEGAAGTAIGDIQRVDRATVLIFESGAFKIGMQNGTLYDAEGVQMYPLSTKFVNFDMPQSTDIENHIYIESDKPTPLVISGLSYRGVSYSGE